MPDELLPCRMFSALRFRWRNLTRLTFPIAFGTRWPLAKDAPNLFRNPNQSSRHIVSKFIPTYREVGEKSPFHSSYEKGCQGKKASPRPSERCGRGDLHPAPPHSSPYS